MDVGLSEWIALVSVFVAVCALIVAILAKCDARKSNELAKGGNKFAREANKLSMKANSIAEEAKVFAEEANEISKRAEQREIEDHAVAWTHHWVDDGVLRVVNSGEDEAIDAVVRLSADGVPVNSERQNVAAGDWIEIRHGQLRGKIRAGNAQHAQQVREHRETEAGMRAMGLPSYREEPMDFGTWATIKINVEWTTPLGRPRSLQLENGRDCF